MQTINFFNENDLKMMNRHFAGIHPFSTFVDEDKIPAIFANGWKNAAIKTNDSISEEDMVAVIKANFFPGKEFINYNQSREVVDNYIHINNYDE
jgi:hypothetical protein